MDSKSGLPSCLVVGSVVRWGRGSEVMEGTLKKNWAGCRGGSGRSTRASGTLVELFSKQEAGLRQLFLFPLPPSSQTELLVVKMSRPSRKRRYDEMMEKWEQFLRTEANQPTTQPTTQQISQQIPQQIPQNPLQSLERPLSQAQPQQAQSQQQQRYANLGTASS